MAKDYAKNIIDTQPQFKDGCPVCRSKDLDAYCSYKGNIFLQCGCGYYKNYSKGVFVDVDTFIKNHNHIRYCEAIINPQGLIEYAYPSHLISLIRYSGISEDKIYDELMPQVASPIHWLIDYTKCISVWYNNCLTPHIGITKEQAETMKKLIYSGVISSDLVINGI